MTPVRTLQGHPAAGFRILGLVRVEDSRFRVQGLGFKL